MASITLEGGLDARETAEERAQRQVQAWKALAGAWEADTDFEEEVALLYAGRTAGRDITLRHSATLVTGNRKHYERIPGLIIEDWLRPAAQAGPQS